MDDTSSQRSRGSAETTARLTLWNVEVFVTAAEERSVTSAAARLGASVATVSQQLSKLEDGIGLPLFDRTTRPWTLTPAGEMFLRRANGILNEAELARAELARAHRGGLMRLRLGMIEDFDSDVTPRLLSDMAGQLKRCQFLLETGATHRLFEQFQARALDAVVAAGGAPADGDLEIHELMTEPFILALPADWSPDRITKAPMIQYTSRHIMGRQILEHLRREGLEPVHRFELDSYHAILAMVAEGAGWTILTPLAWHRAHRFRDQVAIHPMPVSALSRTISLYARPGVLGDMPAEMATRLRVHLDEMVRTPLVEGLPWLAGSLRIAPAD